MPWCTACDRFLSPSTVRVDGTCPRCGRIVDPGRAHHAATTGTPPPAPSTVCPTDAPLEPIPWHLKLLLAALVIYLAYRAFQGVEWLIAHL